MAKNETRTLERRERAARSAATEAASSRDRWKATAVSQQKRADDAEDALVELKATVESLKSVVDSLRASVRASTEDRTATLRSRDQWRTAYRELRRTFTREAELDSLDSGTPSD